MICPSCGSDRAHEARNYDTGEDWWLCPECGDGAPLTVGLSEALIP
jgi:transposase-like protein